MFGRLEVVLDGRSIPLGGVKQRALLGVLLLERGRTVSSDELIDAIWSGDPPETAQKIVQVYVSGLRKALGEGRILTRGRSYELVVRPGEVDVDVFEALVREAAMASVEAAASRLRKALGLVRGRPLADIALEPWAAPEVGRIEERVLAATEARIQADLALGRHGELVPELGALVAAHPFREQLTEQLMLALYRSGRQAEALEAYRRVAERLREDLGLEPGRSLHDLEAGILCQDPALDGHPVRALEDLSSRQRRRGWKLATAGSIVVLLAAVGAIAVAVTRDESASLASVPAGIAIVDAETGALVARVSEAEIPVPAEVVSGNGNFWVWNLNPYSLVEISPRTGEVLKRIGSPFSGDVGWFLPEGESVWFTGTQQLVRIDAREGRAVDRYTLAATSHRLGLAGIARCGGSLWVASPGKNLVLRVDPTTGKIEARIPTKDPGAVACGAGGLWATSNGIGLDRIDPRTNTIVATAPLAIHFYAVAVGGGYAWTTDETSGTLFKVDRTGRVVASYETGDGAKQVSYASGRVWVANSDAGTITGVDAATGNERTYRFGHPVQSVGALGGTLLVELNDGLTYEDRINALKGDVARLIIPNYKIGPVDPALAWNPWLVEAERATCSMLLTPRVGAGEAGRPLSPDIAAAAPRVSADRRTYTFTVRAGRRFAPPSNAPVTAATVRFSIERALSRKLDSDTPGIELLGDIVGARSYHDGRAARVRGIRVSGNIISFTLIRPAQDFLERLSLPIFCTVPATTAVVEGGVEWLAPPSAGPYYMSDYFPGEYTILKRNPNYSGPHPGRIDAIAFREGISPEHAVARVEAGTWDGAILADSLLAPGGIVARNAAASSDLRYEVLRFRTLDHPSVNQSVFALLSRRLGCDAVPGVLDLATLCITPN
jgi:DNA-binding SARP family transcriptional activator/streptogramin lyase